MTASHPQGGIDTTLGDLIAALSDAAFEYCEDKRGAYLLASLALEAILKRAPLKETKTRDLLGEATNPLPSAQPGIFSPLAIVSCRVGEGSQSAS